MALISDHWTGHFQSSSGSVGEIPESDTGSLVAGPVSSLV
jgi:hypothetical protein